MMFGLVAIAFGEQQNAQRNTARLHSFLIAGMVVKRMEVTDIRVPDWKKGQI